MDLGTGLQAQLEETVVSTDIGLVKEGVKSSTDVVNDNVLRAQTRRASQQKHENIADPAQLNPSNAKWSVRNRGASTSKSKSSQVSINRSRSRGAAGRISLREMKKMARAKAN